MFVLVVIAAACFIITGRLAIAERIVIGFSRNLWQGGSGVVALCNCRWVDALSSACGPLCIRTSDRLTWKTLRGSSVQGSHLRSFPIEKLAVVLEHVGLTQREPSRLQHSTFAAEQSRGRTISGMSPSSAFGSAMSSRIVVSSVLILTDGIHEPYKAASIGTDDENHASSLKR